MSNLFHRSRRNLARWFTLSMGSILIVFASIVYFGVVSDCQRAFDRELYSKSRVMALPVFATVCNKVNGKSNLMMFLF